MAEHEVPLASNLRRIRRQRGLSVVALSRLSGTARATLTQLESGAGNPTLETLYALANALDSPLADLITPAPPPDPTRIVRAGSGARVIGESVEAWLLASLTRGAESVEIYDFGLRGAAVQHSAAHPDGTREHLYLHAGRVRVGPVDEPVDLAPGDFVSFDAGRDHLYQRVGRSRSCGLLVITHATA